MERKKKIEKKRKKKLDERWESWEELKRKKTRDMGIRSGGREKGEIGAENDWDRNLREKLEDPTVEI